MRKNTILYDENQQEEIENFIEEQWGTRDSGYICHEMKSEYVHTDVQVISDEEGTILATFGVGAREMNSPLPDYTRTELLMYASSALGKDTQSNQTKPLMTACAELTHISKFPFRENTWLGPGHTINATDQFKEEFGYAYFLFVEYPEAANLSDIGDVHYLIVIPVYEEEVQMMIENREYASFLQAYFEYYEDSLSEREIFQIDVKRPNLANRF